MGQALYRKYRSKNLAEIVGQDHITSTLNKAIEAGKISHAYLFTGPKGVGKTSIARILAHEINNLPYTDDANHLDIIEIDAASNRRIDEIRDLRDKVHIAPAMAKYKVYIIDEVHMLTREAFNALLKTLEEPPAHVVFILATTEAHKLPETIVSRTQRFSFKPVPHDQVVTHLKQIAKAEKIKISDDALDYIATVGEGSFRDSISLLDQAGSSGGSIDLASIQALLGVAPVTAIDELVGSLATNATMSTVLEQLANLYEQGYQPAQLSHQLTTRLRQSIIDNQPVLGTETTLKVLDELIGVPASHNPERALEVTLLRTISSNPKETATAIRPAGEPAVKHVEPVVAKPKESTKEMKTATKAAAKEKPQKQAETIATNSLKPLDEAVWADVLVAVKAKYYTLYSVLKTAQPVFTSDGIELVFAFAFHQRRINEAKNRAIVADILKSITGQSVQIVCTLGKAAPAPLPAKPDPGIASISNIFGGGELLES